MCVCLFVRLLASYLWIEGRMDVSLSIFACVCVACMCVYVRMCMYIFMVIHVLFLPLTHQKTLQHTSLSTHPLAIPSLYFRFCAVHHIFDLKVLSCCDFHSRGHRGQATNEPLCGQDPEAPQKDQGQRPARHHRGHIKGRGADKQETSQE